METDAFALMPDHVHAVIGLREGAPALSEAVRAFKTFSARRINACHGASGHPVWQRGYYDQIIRGERHLAAVRRYVATNAQRATMHP